VAALKVERLYTSRQRLRCSTSGGFETEIAPGGFSPRPDSELEPVPEEEEDNPGEARLGSSAQRYRWLGEVNRGGVGIILGARDPVIGRRVAVKVLRPELENDSRVVREFAQEAQVTGQLDHPNIIPVYDFGEGERSPFMVMKWIAGRTLAQRLRGEKHASVDQLRQFVQILLRLCDALSFAHSRGVIHCDLKPENVMVGDHGQVYLMDWGMALVKATRAQAALEQVGLEQAALEQGTVNLADNTTVAAERGRRSEPIGVVSNAATPRGEPHEHQSFVETLRQDVVPGQARGTPAYMAPEQMFGLVDEIDERTDVFGLGGILCEILLGEPPNNQRTLVGSGTPGRHWTAPIASGIWPQLPPELCRITQKALAPKREDRYPSIAALRLELEQFLHGGGWFETRVYRAGEAIVTEGDAGDTAYIIEQGHCDVFKLADGREVLIRRLGPGAVFGEMAVFTGGTRTASVVAVDDVTLKVITGASLTRELDRNPWVAAFVRSLAMLLRDTEDRSSRPPQ
jgi:serine/threonine protein kinase